MMNLVSFFIPRFVTLSLMYLCINEYTNYMIQGKDVDYKGSILATRGNLNFPQSKLPELERYYKTNVEAQNMYVCIYI